MTAPDQYVFVGNLAEVQEHLLSRTDWRIVSLNCQRCGWFSWCWVLIMEQEKP
jgi:hypothetical protein